MDYKNFLKTEVFFKTLSKVAGLGKSFILLFLFGFSKDLDSYYFALSLVGLLLSIPVVFELLYMGELKDKIEDNNIKSLNNLTLKFISIVSVLLIFSISLVPFFYKDFVLKNVLILLVWAFFFNLNSFNVLVLRIKHKYKIIGWYFLLFPLIITIILLFFYYLLNFRNSIIASFSMLLSELFLFIYLQLKTKTKLFFNEKLNLISLFDKKKISQIVKSFSLISAVYIIDVTDKSFSYNLEGGYTTVLIYGSLVPLIIRQALDFKSVFYHRLQYSLTINSDLHIFYQTLKWLLCIIIPLIVLLSILLQFLKLNYLNKFIKITQEQFDDLLNVFNIYMLILPVYIIWDMMYRIYYKNNYLNKLFKIMLIGVILNYLLNYFFVNIIDLKTSGIALSTLIVLTIYCFYSYMLLRIKEQKNQ